MEVILVAEGATEAEVSIETKACRLAFLCG